MISRQFSTKYCHVFSVKSSVSIRDIQTVQHYCHVFSVKSSSLAHDIILTLGESFEVAYQLAMKERSLEEAMAMDQSILEQTISCSDTDDSMSLHSTISTSTV
ncbi:hypothetical protein DPMN_014142 [Dreissena polymorpha]|uniref:PID domain-containing protein n=1 Tax=Dreissena polymorpha TaxID=45954 RepID=A0A9D4S4Y3_DREPO|nr:hypothetical protein DPMN_014142 [Dreissena polymorpha]